MYKILYLFAFLALTSATQSESDDLLASALKIVKDCGDRSLVLCLKVRYKCSKKII